MRNTLFISFLFLQFSSFGQKVPDFSDTKKIPLESEGFSVWAEVYTSEKEIKTDDDKFYSWVKANIVHATQGSYDGRLLHGTYVEYYSDNQLKQKGEFKNGLRIGEWKSWYLNGKIREITHWKDGMKNGSFIRYTENGSVESYGKFNDNFQNGKIHFKDSSGKDTVISYENGKPIAPKIKKERKKKNEIIPLEEDKKTENMDSTDLKKDEKVKKNENKVKKEKSKKEKERTDDPKKQSIKTEEKKKSKKKTE